MKEIATMAVDQGVKLDIVIDNIDETYENVKEAK
jgi:hypothetical protein